MRFYNSGGKYLFKIFATIKSTSLTIKSQTKLRHLIHQTNNTENYAFAIHTQYFRYSITGVRLLKKLTLFIA